MSRRPNWKYEFPKMYLPKLWTQFLSNWDGDGGDDNEKGLNFFSHCWDTAGKTASMANRMSIDDLIDDRAKSL